MSNLKIMNDSFNQLLENNSYKLKHKIGNGGCSEIYLVENIHYHIFFVAKICNLNNFQSNSMKETSFIEIEILKQINHPNIIKIYNHFFNNNYNILILEYCPESDLLHYIKKNGLFKINEIKKFFKPIIEALIYLKKKGISHSDIKPSNILIDKYNRPILSDFGLGKKINNINFINKLSGSIPFFSPEMFGNKYYDPFQSDVWSLGITIYFCVIGKIPWIEYNYETLKKLIKNGLINLSLNIDQKIQIILKKMLKINPNERITFEDLLKEEIFKYKNYKKINNNISKFYTFSINKTFLKN